MTAFYILHRDVDPNDPQGKTYREVNLSKQHQIPLGTLVEVLPYEDGDHTGCRLFVVHHSRDCDGEPLYALSWDKNIDLENLYAPRLSGMAEEDLRIVDPPPVFIKAY